MKKKAYGWYYNPHHKSGQKVPEMVKLELEKYAKILIASVLKPKYIKGPPKNQNWNYIVDIFGKWHGNSFNFISKYACPAPNAISPFFDVRFARMEYSEGNDKTLKFNIYLMRHTGKWFEIASNITMKECFEKITEGGLFTP